MSFHAPYWGYSPMGLYQQSWSYPTGGSYAAGNSSASYASSSYGNSSGYAPSPNGYAPSPTGGSSLYGFPPGYHSEHLFGEENKAGTPDTTTGGMLAACSPATDPSSFGIETTQSNKNFDFSAFPAAATPNAAAGSHRQTTNFWHHWLSKNERLRSAAEQIVRLKQSGATVRLEEFRTFLDTILQEKLGFEVASHVGSYMLSHGIVPNSHFFSIYCLIFSRDPSLEGYEKVSQMFQYVRPLNAHTFASLIRCHGALHDHISAVRVLKHFREIVPTLSANDLKYRFTVYQAAHDVLQNTQWSYQIQQWIVQDKVEGVDGGRKAPPPEMSLPKIYMADDKPTTSTSEANSATDGFGSATDSAVPSAVAAAPPKAGEKIVLCLASDVENDANVANKSSNQPLKQQ